MATDDKSLTRHESQDKICFVIMPFTVPEGYDSDHFEKVYDQIYVPAIKAAGYKPDRVDKDLSSSPILAKIVNNLIHAPMVLCDMSARNPNVFYELGIRHAFDKPVVLVQDSESEFVFDVSSIFTCTYKKTRKYEEVMEAREKIENAIKATAESHKNSSVIQLANVQHATVTAIESMPPDQSRVMLNLLSEMQALDSRFGDLLQLIRLLERRVDRSFIAPALNNRGLGIGSGRSRLNNSKQYDDDLVSVILKQQDIPNDTTEQTESLEAALKREFERRAAGGAKG